MRFLLGHVADRNGTVLKVIPHPIRCNWLLESDFWCQTIQKPCFWNRGKWTKILSMSSLLIEVLSGKKPVQKVNVSKLVFHTHSTSTVISGRIKNVNWNQSARLFLLACSSVSCIWFLTTWILREFIIWSVLWIWIFCEYVSWNDYCGLMGLSADVFSFACRNRRKERQYWVWTLNGIYVLWT